MKIWSCTLILAFLLALDASPSAALGEYLTGEVSIMVTERNLLYSAGLAECWTYFGSVAETCLISIGHTIYDVADNHIIGSTYVSINQQYDNYVQAAPQALHCYRARLTASIPGSTNAWGSSRVCTSSAPDKPNPTDCPVILDIAGSGFHLTGLDDPVHFDLDANGAAEEIGWTAADAQNGFLCMDRNHDGIINDGRELFGQVAPLLNGQPAELGYLALAELDRPEAGGNMDGFVGLEDARFADLCVWIDASHDGLSQPNEILTLAQARIVRLGYDYVENRRQDQYGNELRYRSKAWVGSPAGLVRETGSYDVFFVQR